MGGRGSSRPSYSQAAEVDLHFKICLDLQKTGIYYVVPGESSCPEGSEHDFS